MFKTGMNHVPTDNNLIITDAASDIDNSKKHPVLYFTGGLLALFIIIGILIFALYNRAEVEEMNDVFLVELATGMADKISAIAHESAAILRTSHAALLHHDTDEKNMFEVLSHLRKVAGFDNLYIALNGEPPLDGIRIPLKTKIPLTLGDTPDGEILVSDPIRDEYSGREFFTIGTPLCNDGIKIGELYGLYYLDNFASLLDLKSFGGDAFYHLCTVDGVPLVLSGNNDNLFKDGDMYSFIGSLDIQNGHTVESIREDMKNGETTLLKYKINNEERTAVMVTVPNTDWCVISIILDEVSVEMANHINRNTLLFSIFMIVIFGGFVTSTMVYSMNREKKLEDALLSSRRLAKKLKTTVETDSLTKVLTRATATERIVDIIATVKADGLMHTLMIADVDNFKLINDTYGHQTGDVYLQKFVEAVKDCLRSEDVLGRLGGDEFIILLNDVDSKDDAQKVAVRILDAVNAITIADVDLEKVGTSIGLVMIPNFGTDYDELNNMADKALYDAKRAGKQTYTFYGDLIEKK